MIRTTKLNIKLGGQQVLKDVSLMFQPGRVTVLLGPNGAGKSSLLRSLAGLLPSDAIFLDDTPLQSLTLQQKARRIGYLPQNGSPAWDISARELVSIGRLPFRSRFAAESENDRAKIDAALKATDTEHLADRTVGDLSGGELARVKLARMVAGDPDWLLADEPLANLDPAHQRDILRLFRQMASAGKGVIIVLHQLDAALSVADEVVLLKDRTILANGPSRSVITQPNLERLFDTEFKLLQMGHRSAIAQSW